MDGDSGWPLTRRETLLTSAGITAVGLSQPWIREAVSSAVNEWNFKITDSSLNSQRVIQGDTVIANARIKNTGQKLGTVTSKLTIQKPDGSVITPREVKTYDIPVGESKVEYLGWPIPENAPVGTYTATVKTFTAPGNHLFDQSQSHEFEVHDDLKKLVKQGAIVIGRLSAGALFGDGGVKYDLPGSDSISYYIGWVMASIAPVADFPFDIRDCAVVNDTWGTNALDCGGAVISTLGSAGTFAGAGLTVFSGGKASFVGIPLASISFAVDTAEDVITDLGRITKTMLRESDVAARKVAIFLRAKLTPNQYQKVLDELPTKQADELGAVGKFAWKIDNPPYVSRKIVMTEGQYTSHIATHGADTMSRTEVRTAVEKADVVYERVGQEGPHIYWFVRKIDDDNWHWVSVTDHSSVGSNATYNYVNNAFKVQKSNPKKYLSKKMPPNMGKVWTRSTN